MTILSLMGLALAYALLMLHIDKVRSSRHENSDEEALSLLAFQLECSVFDLFMKAGEHWSFSRAKIDADFNSYIRQGDIPHYLSTYVRQHAHPRRTYQDKLFTGNKLPPSIVP
jgi:hypothetical protein